MKDSLRLYISNGSPNFENIYLLLAGSSLGYPVVASDFDVKEFVNSFEERASKSRGGAPENEKWAAIMVQVAAIMLLDQQQGKRRSDDAVAVAALAAVAKIPGQKLPAERGVADKVAEIRRVMKL